MIQSKPLYNTSFALFLFFVMVTGSFFYMLHALLANPQFFVAKLVLTPILLVIALFALGKLLKQMVTIQAKSKSLEVYSPITRQRQQIPFDSILGWEESMVKTGKGEFREIKILYQPKKVLKFSNKETSQYKALASHLHKHLPKKKVG